MRWRVHERSRFGFPRRLQRQSYLGTGATFDAHHTRAARGRYRGRHLMTFSRLLSLLSLGATAMLTCEHACGAVVNPVNSPAVAPVAQLDRALRFERSGRRFESVRARISINGSIPVTWIPRFY
jgi:hypothetical protein